MNANEQFGLVHESIKFPAGMCHHDDLPVNTLFRIIILLRFRANLFHEVRVEFVGFGLLLEFLTHALDCAQGTPHAIFIDIVFLDFRFVILGEQPTNMPLDKPA